MTKPPLDVATLSRESTTRAPYDPSRRPSSNEKVVLLALGVLLGTYSTLCGIGGGVFAVPLFHYVWKMPLPIAVANSLVLVLASTTSATVTELFHPRSSIDFAVVGVLIATSFVGTRLGYAVAKKLNVRTLKIVFAVLLTLVALEVLFDTHFRDSASVIGSAASLTPMQWVIVVIIGFAAGFVAPMLGIGGGLIAVPGLVYGVPALGYLGARACSMAMSMFTSWQSVFLYKKDGSLRTHTSGWLAAGALAGGVLGIQLVHVPAVTSSARWLVGFALLFAAGRFAWDLRVAKGVPRR
ncbi:MAG: sulfite exporter TauE/SafE family protein [Planctomycetota bacterium]|nr:sulfite exporter TauE/SafE family protein [Planctomycetota bacterium]